MYLSPCVPKAVEVAEVESLTSFQSPIRCGSAFTGCGVLFLVHEQSPMQMANVNVAKAFILYWLMLT